MIEITHLTKRYGEGDHATTAVDDLSFAVRPGVVTGFLGPNGAGKSTTMRVLLGLDRATSGRATVDGRELVDHPAPITAIGALLEARAVHPRRSARDHLRSLAATTGVPDGRVDEVLGLVGLDAVAGRPAGDFSLGMSQRLGIASALLGDPGTVVLDEPVNGLDPEGIVWIRHLLKALAAEGRTVLVSSHLMSEMALTADHFVIIGRGRLIADVTAEELAAMGGGEEVVVRTPDPARLAEALTRCGGQVRLDAHDATTMEVRGLDAGTIGHAAFDAGVVLVELTPRTGTLESTFMELTHDAVQFSGSAASVQEAA